MISCDSCEKRTSHHMSHDVCPDCMEKLRLIIAIEERLKEKEEDGVDGLRPFIDHS